LTEIDELRLLLQTEIQHLKTKLTNIRCNERQPQTVCYPDLQTGTI